MCTSFWKLKSGKLKSVNNTIFSKLFCLNTCTVHLLLFCTMTNKFTIISQIITLLHVSTLIVSSSGSLLSIPCQVTQVFRMQLLVIQLCNLEKQSYYQRLHLKYLCNLARYWLQAVWGWHNSVETCSCVIICEIIVHLLDIVENLRKKQSRYRSGMAQSVPGI